MTILLSGAVRDGLCSDRVGSGKVRSGTVLILHVLLDTATPRFTHDHTRFMQNQARMNTDHPGLNTVRPGTNTITTHMSADCPGPARLNTVALRINTVTLWIVQDGPRGDTDDPG